MPAIPEPDSRPVGEQLRVARERQALELLTVARALRIPIKTLDALERGDFSSLPADVYVRGFLKQYATVLGLDSIPLLRAAALERSRVPSAAVTFPWTERRQKHSRLWEILSPRTTTLLAGGLGLFAVLLYVILQVRTYARPPHLEVFEPPQDTEVLGAAVLAVHGRTDPTAELSINGERTLVREDGMFEESIGLGEGVNTLRFLARSIGGRETVVVREVLVRPTTGPPDGASLAPTSGPPGEPAPGASPASSPSLRPGSAQASGSPLTLTVRADTEVVWVSITTDGKTAFSGLLLPGSEQSVSGKTISITSGKAARTVVRVDGLDHGTLAETPGVARGVTFTRNPNTGIVEKILP